MDQNKDSYKSQLYGFLDKLPRSEWPRAWWQAGHDEWPFEGQPPAEWPKGAEELSVSIEKRIGAKACVRYYNTAFGKITDQMFDDWWDSIQEKSLNEIRKEIKDFPKRFGEQSTAEGGKNSNRPVMAALRAFFFGCLGGILSGLLLKLLELL